MDQTIVTSHRSQQSMLNRNSIASFASSTGSDQLALSPDEVQQFIDQIKTRSFATIPPVGRRGLPPLEVMNIPHYDSVQWNVSPSADQRLTQRVQARRGPRYMLSFINKKLGYHLPELSEKDGDDRNLQRVWTMASAMTTASSFSNLNSLRTEITPTTLQVRPQQLTPTSPELSRSTQQQVRDGVFAKLKKKVSFVGSRKPPSPAISEHEEESSFSSTGSSLDLTTTTHCTTSTSIATSSTTGSTAGENLRVADSQSVDAAPPKPSTAAHLLRTPPPSNSTPISAFSIHNPGKKGNRKSTTASVLNLVSGTSRSPSLSLHEVPRTSNSSLSNTAAAGAKSKRKSEFIRRFKKSHKYLANMGSLQIPGTTEKRQFELIIDPRFPRSYIDMGALLRELTHNTGNTAKDDSAISKILTQPFHIVATPVYDPVSVYNRVVIECKLIPMQVMSPASPITPFETLSKRNSFTPSAKSSLSPPPSVISTVSSPATATTAATSANPCPPSTLVVDPFVNFNKTYLNASVTYREMMINSCQPRDAVRNDSPIVVSAPISERRVQQHQSDISKPSLERVPFLESHSSTSTARPLRPINDPRSSTRSASASASAPPVPPKDISKKPERNSRYAEFTLPQINSEKHQQLTSAPSRPTPKTASLFEDQKNANKKASKRAELRAAAVTGYTASNATAAGNFSIFSHTPSSQKQTNNNNNHNAVISTVSPPSSVDSSEIERTRQKLELDQENQRIQNDLFTAQWEATSLGVISLTDISPYNCILGSDWLDLLYEEAYREEDEIDEENDSESDDDDFHIGGL